VAVAAAVMATAALALAPGAPPRAAGRRPAVLVTSPSATTSTVPAPAVRWAGAVEHLFFHPLVIRPELAFTRDRLAQGFRNFFLTAGEFRAVLAQLDRNGWTLVDIHRAVAGEVRVPPGRRPFVLSVDDVNYYDYSRTRGLGWRLVLDPAGDVKVESRDDRGVRLTDDDIVPIIDEFVSRHPQFSADGAKGVLAVTAYQGLLGERLDDRRSQDRAGSVERATALARRLQATGWVFADHSYGHIDFARAPLAVARRDIERWQRVAEPIVGPTDLFVYPFGAAPPPSSPLVAMLRDHGYTVICDIDVAPRFFRAQGIVIMSRRHIDGLALRQEARPLAPFFDVASVEDRAARSAGLPRAASAGRVDRRP
jgi:hypothetical protein